ncbi:MAG TPA: hypothetical protein VL334_05400 [Anaerolineae bacterium]|nr:hypothetical protein [Anaerolineae bacterium]
MAPIATAIQSYLDLATPQMLADSWAVLEQGMRSGHLMFGDRLLSSALRPQLVTVQEWQAASRMSSTLVSAFDKAYLAMLGDPKLRAQVWLTPEEEILVGYEAGTRLPVPIGRLDCSLIHRDDGDPSLHLLEYNAESPAAVAYEDGLAEVFLQTPLLQAFRERFPVRPLWARPAALQTLLRIYREWGGRELPTVAIVDWQGLPTAHEFILFQEYFARQGIRSLIVDPDAMTYEGGVLYAGGVAVDFVYKRILTHELLARYGVEHPIVYAVRDRAVCMMNRFSCKLLHKKASLALLSDERNASLFTADEQAAIQRHIPWTRRVEERTTLFDGTDVDLLPFILANRERLVLKPNDEYGGKGVVLGWDASGAEWQQAVDEALQQPSVVQLRVPLGYEDFPVVLPGGGFDVQPRFVDFDPFIFDGHYAGGCLTRLSAGGLLNVTAGGGTTVPTMVVAV